MCLITEQLQLTIDYLSKIPNCGESIIKEFCVRKSPLSEEIMSENRYFFSNEKKRIFIGHKERKQTRIVSTTCSSRPFTCSSEFYQLEPLE